MSWTPERVAELERLWWQGLGSAQIAARLGVSPTTLKGAIETLRRTGRANLPYRITRTRWPPEKIAELEALWAKGWTINHIAAHFGTTPRAIQTLAAKHRARGANLPTRPTGPRDVKWTEERKAEFARMWREGRSNEQLASEFGVLPTKVANLASRLRKGGLDLPSRARRELSLGQVVELERLWREKVPVRAIASALGVPRSSLMVAVEALRAAGHDLPEREPLTSVLSDGELIELMGAGMSASQIAERYGLDKGTVRRRAAKLRASGVRLPKARGSQWPRQQTSALVRHWRAGLSVEQIATRLHTTPSAIHQQAQRLRKRGIELPPRAAWPSERDDALSELWRQGLNARQIADRLGATEPAIRARIKALRPVDPANLPARRGVRPGPTIAQLEELWPEKLSYQEMAAQLGCSTITLSHAVEAARKHGVDLPHRPKRMAWPEERRSELVRLWADPTLTVGQIATRLDVSTARLSSIVVRFRAQGYDLPARVPPLWPPEQVEALEALWLAGERKDRIAAHFGVTVPELQNMVTRLRAKGADLPSGRPAQVWTNDRIVELEAMWAAGEPTARIAARFGVREGALASAIHYLRQRGHHLPLRGNSVWDDARITELEALWAQGATTEQIAAHMGVTPRAVSMAVRKARQEGRSLPRRARWSAWDAARDSALLALNAERLPREEIAQRLGTTKPAIERRLARLRASETAA